MAYCTCSDGDGIIVVGAAESLGHFGEVQAHGEVAVAQAASLL